MLMTVLHVTLIVNTHRHSRLLADGGEIPWIGQLSITGPTRGQRNTLKHKTIHGHH